MQKLAVVVFGDVLYERRLDWSEDVVHWRVFITMFRFNRMEKYLYIYIYILVSKHFSTLSDT